MAKGVFIKGDVVESETKPKTGVTVLNTNTQQVEAKDETPEKEKDSSIGQTVHTEETVRKTS